MRSPHVVIIGGGFGGLHAARALADAPVRVTLIDRRNHHLFQPLLYQVATAALNPSDVAAPIRAILRDQKNATVLLGEVVDIDVEARKVMLNDDELAYDFLIVATGARHSYFGRPEWERHAPGLKSIDDALEIRRRIFTAFEEAERETDKDAQNEWLTFVVVGGGPTGVELSGAVAEIAKKAMTTDFRSIDPRRARVILVEGRERALPAYHSSLSSKAETALGRLGVEVITNAVVRDIDEHNILIGDDRVATRTVIWAAGVEASPLAQCLGVPLDRAGRVLVHSDLSIPHHRNVFVIGDLAAVKFADGSIVPGVAQAAMQGGEHAALNIRRAIRGESPVAFRYRDKGSLATIGKAAAVADVAGVRFSGFPAWLFWLFLHIFYLVGFRRRLLVMTQWVWAFATSRRGVRLITGGPKGGSLETENVARQSAGAGDRVRVAGAAGIG